MIIYIFSNQNLEQSFFSKHTETYDDSSLEITQNDQI